MGVAVFVGLLANEKSSSTEVGDDVAVSVLYERAGKCSNRFIEGGVGVDRIEDGQVLGSTYRSIVFTEGGSEVNDSRTVVGGDELGRNKRASRRIRPGESGCRMGARSANQPDLSL